MNPPLSTRSARLRLGPSRLAEPGAPLATLLKISLVVGALLAGGGCSREPVAPLRVGTNVWPGYEPLYLAQEQGYYPPGRVKLVEYSSAADVLQAFRNGVIDAATLTLDEVIFLGETTSDVSVVLVLDFSHGADVIMAQPSLADLRALKGKRVGLETGALGAYVLTRALETVGMTPADVRPVSLAISEHERAFKEGRVDAVVTFEPVRTRLLAAGARQLFDSSRIPGEIVDVLVVRRTFAEKNKAQIAQLVRGWFSALGFIRQDPGRAAALMAQREHISAGDFQQALQGLSLAGLAENRAMLAGPSPALLPTARKLSQVMLASQLIRQPPELKGLLDGNFVAQTKP